MHASPAPPLPDSTRQAQPQPARRRRLDSLRQRCWALHQPLPSEITGNTHGWLSRYRRYPVFSPAGLQPARARWPGGAGRGAADAGPTADAHRARQRALGRSAADLLVLALPLFGGPWLGSLVRRRGLAPRQEWLGLLAAVAGAVLAVVLFNEFLAEPMKQRIAQWAGQVDAQGQRKRVALAVGVLVLPGDAASRAMATAPRAAPARRPCPQACPCAMRSANPGRRAALPRWRREREGLAALERERELARAQAQRREAELRLSVLAAQVEPHFLFNTLAGVRSAIRTDPERASEMIDTLVDYCVRPSPAAQRWLGAGPRCAGSSRSCAAYLGLMRARMPRLSVELHAPPELLEASCPPLMLISLAENAIKHGVEPKVGPARISVRAERTGDGRLQLTVEDDGVGFGMAPGAGHAGSGLA